MEINENMTCETGRDMTSVGTFKRHTNIGHMLRIQRSWVGKFFHSKLDSKDRGKAILTHKSISFKGNKIIAEPNCRFVIVSF